MQQDFPCFVQNPDVEGSSSFDWLDVANGAGVCGTDGRVMGRIGNSSHGGDEEANQEVGGDNLASTHAKKAQ